MSIDTEFLSDRTVCRAKLFEPKPKKSNGAGIVLAHGLCGTVDSGLMAYGKAFADAGFHALAFDYRGFGESDGAPRQLVSVPKQIHDWHQAVLHLRRHDNVDSDRIGLWGVSFSGGHVIRLAHDDARIRAAVAQVPMVDPVLSGHVGNYERGEAATAAMAGAVIARAKTRWFSKKFDMLQLAPTRTNKVAVLGSKEAAVYPKIAGPSWRNELHPDSFIIGKFESNNASLLTDDLTKPMLVQMAAQDRIVSNEAIGNFCRRCGPLAQLSVYQGDHFTMLGSNTARRQAIKEAVSFYEEYLIL